jgi:hypothetical protein
METEVFVSKEAGHSNLSADIPYLISSPAPTLLSCHLLILSDWPSLWGKENFKIHNHSLSNKPKDNIPSPKAWCELWSIS